MQDMEDGAGVDTELFLKTEHLSAETWQSISSEASKQVSMVQIYYNEV
ncbi:hypothetical protein HCH03_12185 [Gordonibacter massiliensis]|nr:hypothetical protein [Gordonibacter massiliensis (ex Traore et al. 2017)]